MGCDHGEAREGRVRCLRMEGAPKARQARLVPLLRQVRFVPAGASGVTLLDVIQLAAVGLLVALAVALACSPD